MAVLEGLNEQAYQFFAVVFFGSNNPYPLTAVMKRMSLYLYSSLTLSLIYVTGRACQSQLTGKWGGGPKDDDGKILLFSSNRRAVACCSANTVRRKTKGEERRKIKAISADISEFVRGCDRKRWEWDINA